MVCDEGSSVDRVVCAIEGLAPTLWEQLLPVAAILISVGAPFLVARWVAKRSRTDTLDAVQRQIEASQGALLAQIDANHVEVERQIDAGRASAMEAVDRQIAAERTHVQRERVRAKIEGFLAASTQQTFLSTEEHRLGFRAMEEASAALELALPWNLRTAIEPWLSKIVGYLIDVRLEKMHGRDDGDLLNLWLAHNYTIAVMLFDDGTEEKIVREIATKFSDDMKARIAASAEAIG